MAVDPLPEDDDRTECLTFVSGLVLSYDQLSRAKEVVYFKSCAAAVSRTFDDPDNMKPPWVAPKEEKSHTATCVDSDGGMHSIWKCSACSNRTLTAGLESKPNHCTHCGIEFNGWFDA